MSELSAAVRCSAAIALVVAVGGVACGGSGSKVSTAPTTATNRFNALADAYVRANEAGMNFGKNRSLIIDGVPTVRGYLRFEVFGLRGKILRATLRIYSLTPSGDGFQLRATGHSWQEPTATYRNAPAAGRLLELSGPLDENQWRSIDVTSSVGSRPATLDWALVGTGDAQLAIASRESDFPPQLVVETRRGR
jgi:hypothetical protein